MITPLYGQLSPLRIPTSSRFISADADVVAYVLAVEAADGQELEAGLIYAVESFVLGCKSDGIWSALKAACILAGARTLSGALVPLVGAAPTNFNFVSADYNRETGLKGDGASKYLRSNLNNNSTPIDSKHISVWRTSAESRNATRQDAGTGSGTGFTQLFSTTTARIYRLSGVSFQPNDASSLLGLWGVSGFTNSAFERFYQTSLTNIVGTPTANLNAIIDIFGRAGTTFSDSRISFYSFGEKINLSSLNTRVSNLMSALAAAIP